MSDEAKMARLRELYQEERKLRLAAEKRVEEQDRTIYALREKLARAERRAERMATT